MGDIVALLTEQGYAIIQIEELKVLIGQSGLYNGVINPMCGLVQAYILVKNILVYLLGIIFVYDQADYVFGGYSTNDRLYRTIGLLKMHSVDEGNGAIDLADFAFDYGCDYIFLIVVVEINETVFVQRRFQFESSVFNRLQFVGNQIDPEMEGALFKEISYLFVFFPHGRVDGVLLDTTCVDTLDGNYQVSNFGLGKVVLCLLEVRSEGGVKKMDVAGFYMNGVQATVHPPIGYCLLDFIIIQSQYGLQDQTRKSLGICLQS
jgi:hypothetical protein